MSVHTVEENYNLIPLSDRISLGAGSGEVDNFHSSRKDFFHWYWPSL